MAKKMKIEPIVDIKRYNPAVDEGLTYEQVSEREVQGLSNITKSKSKSVFQIICKNFFTFFNMMYLVIFILLAIAKVPISNYLFVVIVLVNLFIGTFQEIRAKIMVDKLSLVSQSKVRVMRESACVEIDRQNLVLDDIMLLSSGNEIASDSILVKGEIEVNESQLTGESVSIRKQVGDILYSGSVVVSGNCSVKVERVGKDNQIEKLSAQAKVVNKPNSQIFKSLNILLRFIAVIIVPLAGLMFYLTFKSLDIDIQTGLPYTMWAKYCISIEKTSGALLGMIPSGLYLLTSMTLAYGVVKLSKHKTLVNDIYCIEMLARTNVLCLDKTGTITDGSMSVTRFIETKTGEYPVEEIIGSMNKALKETNFTAKALENYFGFSQKFIPTITAPFSSENKYSAVTFGEEGTFLIGAPEFVLKSNYAKIEEQVNNYANQGLRVLALAHSPQPLKNGKVSRSPKLVALILIEDQIRPDAIETIKYFKDNGVEVKIISGDNPLTVSEVARRVGVEHSEDAVSLEGLSDDEVRELATKCTIFGRVKPNQKQIIVKALKEQKKTVAMTGDGVNDILALKEADCSVAMASGCDAVKNIAQLVLLDSNFSSMPRIVAEGRRVINNIQQTSMLFLVKTLFIMFLSILFVFGFFKKFSPAGNTFPISPSQLTLVEIFAIGVPAFFLAMQPNYKQISGHFLKNVLRRSLPGALAVAFEVILTYMLSSIIGLNPLQVSTIVIIVTTATCMMILYLACKPFNVQKVFLFLTMTILCMFIIVASTTGKTYLGINFQEQFKLYEIVDKPELKPHDVAITELPGEKMLLIKKDAVLDPTKPEEKVDIYSYKFKLPKDYLELIEKQQFKVNISNGNLKYSEDVDLNIEKTLFNGKEWVEYEEAEPIKDDIMTIYYTNIENFDHVYALVTYTITSEVINATSLLLAVALSEASYIIIFAFNYVVDFFAEKKKLRLINKLKKNNN